QQILADPQHPYTRKLVAAAPSLASRRIQAARSATVDAEVSGGTGALDAELIARAAEREADSSDADLISVKNISKLYRIRQQGFKYNELLAVNDISFGVKKGTTTALVGESGSGKSTVAKLFLQL